MRLAYVAGPYRAPHEFGVKCNIERAEKVAVNLWWMGFAVICPHKNTAFLGGAATDSVWLEGDKEMLRRCDLVVLTDDWEKSSGTLAEIELAKQLNIPVVKHTDTISLMRLL